MWCSPQYRDAVERVIDVLDALNTPDGLYPIYVNANTGMFGNRKRALPPCVD